MNYKITIRLIILFILIILAQFQLIYGKTRQRFSIPIINDDANNADFFNSYDDLDDMTNFDDPYSNIPYNDDQISKPLPIINRSAPQADIDWAIQYLRLPTWSKGYHRCDSKESEVSCYELVRAAKAIANWTKKISDSDNIGQVHVYITNQPFPDRLSMLYHGMQIAIATNRKLVTGLSKFSPFSLPQIIEQAGPFETLTNLPTNHLFGCSDVSHRHLNLEIGNASWPQVLYTHPAIAPFLRENFGFHAAYFLGNYLFGQIEAPDSKCIISSDINDVVEGWIFKNDFELIRPRSYASYLERCGIDTKSASMITNDMHFETDQYKNIVRFSSDSNQEIVCALRTLTSSKRIIQTFGSRLGFWATALQGNRGGFLNGIDRICVNMTNSQQGSLWHTYCPPEKESYLYRTNSWFYICGPNAKDARYYIDYLLW